MQKLIIEAYSRIDETAKIHGVALIPRISRNNNLYTKQELARFDNVTVPLNWEHDSAKKIGTVTFHYNPEIETVYYEGMIDDERAASLARNKTLFTSIEADPVSMKEICNSPDDCFHMPFGLVPVGMALTETPGVPETTVKVIEHYLKECKTDQDLESKYAPYQKALNNEQHMEDLIDKIPKFQEQQPTGDLDNDCVSRKVSILDDEHPDWSQDKKVAVAISMCTESEMKEYVLEKVFKIQNFCPTCGEVKKEQVSITGPTDRPAVKKKEELLVSMNP